MEKEKGISRRGAIKVVGTLAAGAAASGVLGTAEAAGRKKAPRWVMVIDIRRCTGVRACVVACKAEYDTPLGAWNTVVREVESGKYPDVKKDFLPRLCNHCEGNEKEGVPPCVKICPEYPAGRKEYITPAGKKIRYRGGATYKRPDGMILLDNSLCIGCGKCIDACPYGARAFNKKLKAGKDPSKNGITKCSFCQHRVDKGVEPSCVNTCPTSSRVFGDINDPNSEVSKLAKEFKLMERSNETTILPEAGTRPQIYYIDEKNALGNYKLTKENKTDEFKAEIK